MGSPFKVTVYDGNFVRKGFVLDPLSLELHPRHNQQPTGTIEVAADRPYTAAMLAVGSRVTVEYDGQQIMSGPLRMRSGSSGPQSSLTFEIEDDWRLLTRVLGWPNPTGAISAQGALTAYDTKTGPAETVVKWFAQRAITRLGLPVTVATNQGRGATVTVKMRMHVLADRLLPVIDQAGIGVSVVQSGSGLVLDCYEPAWFPLELTERSGIVQSWSYEQQPPMATRTVVGGGGEGTAREFRQVVSASVESAWHDVIETFTDARDVETTLEMTDRGTAALIEGAPTFGFTLKLAETPSFRYGTSIRVGDLVTTRLAPAAAPVTDVVRGVDITWSADDGLLVEPVVGDPRSSQKTLAKAIGAALRAIRIDRAGR